MTKTKTEQRQFLVVYWSVSARGFKVYGRVQGMDWIAAKAFRNRAKAELDFPANPDINGVEIHSMTVLRKNGIIR